MKVNLYRVVRKEGFSSGILMEKGELLATVELEVVPGGTYVIDGKPYIQTGRPTFHIQSQDARGMG